jgi:hypothetical protein
MTKLGAIQDEQSQIKEEQSKMKEEQSQMMENINFIASSIKKKSWKLLTDEDLEDTHPTRLGYGMDDEDKPHDVSIVGDGSDSTISTEPSSSSSAARKPRTKRRRTSVSEIDIDDYNALQRPKKDCMVVSASSTKQHPRSVAASRKWVDDKVVARRSARKKRAGGLTHYPLSK